MAKKKKASVADDYSMSKNCGKYLEKLSLTSPDKRKWKKKHAFPRNHRTLYHQKEDSEGGYAPPELE
ncbi:hypothetical protein H0H81_002157 [Sphagnurus paluster]|uniref:Uncharacterized protein n=1 Tax=Sphagnurus paluster TaxID=117069 RepID=A0A9P7G041_9AGAR|nr:hypothetical protein H0H81_002157 [Sphagnurus paluster]